MILIRQIDECNILKQLEYVASVIGFVQYAMQVAFNIIKDDTEFSLLA